jgi:thiamine-phosphate pyrophosphorylase
VSATDPAYRTMNSSQSHIRGLYAVTPDVRDTDQLCRMVALAQAGGARIFQYRNKLADRSLALKQATALKEITREKDALLIVNDDVELALKIGADGVHLGKDDFDGNDEAVTLGTVRAQACAAGREAFVVGISCYDNFARAQRAASAGATYIAFGSMFPSQTKPHAIPADISLIRKAKRDLSLPVVAIGGITLQNAPELIAASVDAVAVVSSLFQAQDIQARATAFSALFA